MRGLLTIHTYLRYGSVAGGSEFSRVERFRRRGPLRATPKKDKYSLKSPGDIAFSDFRRYEDWSVVSSARTDEELKVVVANPAMLEAFKAGVPGNGQPSDGSFPGLDVV